MPVNWISIFSTFSCKYSSAQGAPPATVGGDSEWIKDGEPRIEYLYTMDLNGTVTSIALFEEQIAVGFDKGIEILNCAHPHYYTHYYLGSPLVHQIQTSMPIEAISFFEQSSYPTIARVCRKKDQPQISIEHIQYDGLGSIRNHKNYAVIHSPEKINSLIRTEEGGIVLIASLTSNFTKSTSKPFTFTTHIINDGKISTYKNFTYNKKEVVILLCKGRHRSAPVQSRCGMIPLKTSRLTKY